jgi:hypothetical protein
MPGSGATSYSRKEANMAKNKAEEVAAKLDTIIGLLQDLFILEASQTRMSRDQLREVLKVSPHRISRIMKEVRSRPDK